MQEAARLLAALGDHMDAIRVHISKMDDGTVEVLSAALPPKPPLASAQMVMFMLVQMEIQRRARRGHGNNVVPFSIPA